MVLFSLNYSAGVDAASEKLSETQYTKVVKIEPFSLNYSAEVDAAGEKLSENQYEKVVEIGTNFTQLFCWGRCSRREVE